MTKLKVYANEDDTLLFWSIPQPIPGCRGLPRWRTIREVIANRGQPPTLTAARTLGGPRAFSWHVVRQIRRDNLERLRYTRPGQMRTNLPDRLRPPCHRGVEDGFKNVYGRMTWDSVAPTITAGCTSLSKGRFGHPDEDRTISVREAACLQTFPEDYMIDSNYIDHACSIVGNALPCDFAEVLARQCACELAARQ